MDASVKWDGGLSFTGTANSGFTVALDGDVAVGGSGMGFRPLELMALSLASCTAMDVISILRKKRQNVTQFEVKLHAQQSHEHPKVFTSIEVEYVVYGPDVEAAAVERAIELSVTKYCPAQAMLSRSIPISHHYRLVATTL